MVTYGMDLPGMMWVKLGVQKAFKDHRVLKVQLVKLVCKVQLVLMDLLGKMAKMELLFLYKVQLMILQAYQLELL